MISAIVVIDEQGAIGFEGGLLCHLPADLRHFKSLTMGHSIVMGRLTFESFPKGPLPGRQNIVVTRSGDYAPEGVTVAHSVSEALSLASMPGDVFVIGGAQIYAATFDMIDTLYLTRIHHRFDRYDAAFPIIDESQWETVDSEYHPADEKNPYPFSFITLVRRK